MALLKDIEETFSYLDSYGLINNQDYFEVKFNYMFNDYNLSVDKDLRYLYLNCKTKDTDFINMNLVQNKDISKVLTFIKNEVEENKTLVEDKNYNDKFGLFRKVKIFSKGNCNYDEIKIQMDKSDRKSELSITSIPKDLLYNRKQIIDMIISEIKMVNSNKSYKHYITASEKDYSFYIIFKFNEIDMKTEIKFDPDLHPFYPPSIKYISPNAKKSLIFSLSNLNILKVECWNPIINLSWLIESISKEIEPYIESHLKSCSESVTDLDSKIIDMYTLLGENPFNDVNIDIKHNKFSLKENNKDDNKYWKSGVGYGTSGRNNWDISGFIKEKSYRNKLLSLKLIEISESLNTDNISKLTETTIMSYIENNISNSTLLEINSNFELFESILKLLEKLVNLMPDNIEFKKWMANIYFGIQKIRNDLSPLINSVEESDRLTSYITLITSIDTIVDYLDDSISEFISPPKYDATEDESDSPAKIYEKFVNEEQENIFSGYEIKSDHLFFKSKNMSLGPKQIVRISSEFSSLRRNLPNNWDSSIILRASQDNLNIFSFVIVGPKDTPYHNGIFEFNAHFPSNYPESEPKVLLKTTGNGTVRFNPNLYDCGKVCLSLLGTWKGQDGESWNKDNSTFLQVLISIQSLILVEEPYFNEPGWERDMFTQTGRQRSFAYNDNIRYENLRWGILENMENPPYGFEEFSKKHFEMKKDEILEVSKKWTAESIKYKEQMSILRKKILSYYDIPDSDEKDSEEKDSEEKDSDENEEILKSQIDMWEKIDESKEKDSGLNMGQIDGISTEFLLPKTTQVILQNGKFSSPILKSKINEQKLFDSDDELEEVNSSSSDEEIDV